MKSSKSVKSNKSSSSSIQPTEFFRSPKRGGIGKKTKAARVIKAKSGKAASGTAKKMSGLAAAARLLVESKQPLNAQEIIKALATKGYWKSPGGKTPHATMHAAMSREIRTKGKDSRFRKAERGLFAANRKGN